MSTLLFPISLSFAKIKYTRVCVCACARLCTQLCIFSPTMKSVNCWPYSISCNEAERPMCHHHVQSWVYMQTCSALHTTQMSLQLLCDAEKGFNLSGPPFPHPQNKPIAGDHLEICSPVEFCEAGKVLIYQTVTVRVHFQKIRSHGHIPALVRVNDSISQNSTHTYVFRSMWMAEPCEHHLDSPEEESQINQHSKWRFVYKYETLSPSQPQNFSARLFPQLSTCVQETFGETFMVDVRPLLRPR